MSKTFKQGTTLLVTSQVSQRSGLRKTLVDFGMDNKSIEIAGDFEQAKARLAGEPVSLLITDDELGNHAGLSLMELHRRNNPASKDRIFILMINESSPFLVADFTLKGGDVLINKPFTNDSFISTLNNAINFKEKLSYEEKLALDVQDAIKAKDIDKALEIVPCFNNPESIHALFSQGLVNEAQLDLELAYKNYKQVIEIQPDFKSLMNLVKVGTTLQKHLEMIEYAEIWVKKFPLHHSSIQDISRIIIANKRFELLDEIFDLFAKHKIKDSLARIPIAAGFVMASVHHFDSGNMDKSKEYANKAIEYSCKRMPVISKALEMLMKVGENNEAEVAYRKLDLPVLSEEDKVVDLKLKNIIYSKNQVMVDCLKLLSQKVIDPDVYKITISCLKHIGKDPHDIIHQARKAYPHIPFD